MKIRNKALIWLSAAVFTVLMRLLFRTLKLECRLEHPDTSPYAQSNRDYYIYCIWHDTILISTFGGKHWHSTALTSRHSDGTFVAEVLKFVGVPAIRGSTNRITPSAVRDLLRATENQNIVIAPDGPRGPNRQMSDGIVHIASHTGLAIVPTACSCSSFWTIKGSWSDMIVPKPFSHVYLLAAEPVHVPSDLRSDGRKQYVAKVQVEMDRLANLAESLAKRQPEFAGAG